MNDSTQTTENGGGREVAKQPVQPKPALVARDGNVTAIIPATIEEAYRLSQIVCSAQMAPKAYNNNVNAVMVGIMHGMEVGLTPMAALQSIAVINGMPSIWGDGALGLVLSSGLLEHFEETIEGEGEKAVATCVCRRKGQSGEIKRTFSFDDAKTAGLSGKQGPWQQYPKRMLQMRARSWALRDGFADVLRGLSVAEESTDMQQLYQAEDGSYVPKGRPLREQYVEEDERRRKEAAEAALQKATEQQADDDAKRMDEEARAAMGGRTLADEETEPAEDASTVASESVPAGQDAADGGTEEGDSEGEAAAAPAPEPEYNVAHGVPVFDQNGQECGSFRQPKWFFRAITNLVKEARDPQRVIEANEKGANAFVNHDERNMGLWNDCVKLANDKTAQREAAAGG